VVVVQPGVIIGPGFWNSGTGEMFKIVAEGFSYFTSGTVGVVDVNDVVEAMILLTNSKIVNEQFIVISENVTYKELIQMISVAIGDKDGLKEIKRWQLLVYLQIDKLLSFIPGRKRSLYKANINSAFKQLKYDTAKIEKATGIKFISAQKSVNNTASFYEV